MHSLTYSSIPSFIHVTNIYRQSSLLNSGGTRMSNSRHGLCLMQTVVYRYTRYSCLNETQKSQKHKTTISPWVLKGSLPGLVLECSLYSHQNISGAFSFIHKEEGFSLQKRTLHLNLMTHLPNILYFFLLFIAGFLR